MGGGQHSGGMMSPMVGPATAAMMNGGSGGGLPNWGPLHQGQQGPQGNAMNPQQTFDGGSGYTAPTYNSPQFSPQPVMGGGALGGGMGGGDGGGALGGPNGGGQQDYAQQQQQVSQIAPPVELSIWPCVMTGRQTGAAGHPAADTDPHADPAATVFAEGGGSAEGG